MTLPKPQKFQRRTPEVEAFVFDDTCVPLDDEARELGFEGGDGYPYTFHGVTVGFGDVIVLTTGVKPVWDADSFRSNFVPKGKKA